MILAALMFVLGAWCVQQMAQLPTVTELLSCAAVIAVILGGGLYLNTSSFSQQANTSPRALTGLIKSAATGIAALLFGICWASGFAHWRMSDQLPRQWEQKSIVIIGVVASVPEVTERGERFRFDVENVLTKNAVVPSHISLSQYTFFGDNPKPAANTPNAVPDYTFHAGERWQLMVRLKRPHSTANPHGFDFESWALGENIRATGSVKSNPGNKKLAEFIWRPSYVVEYAREHIKQRIERVLVDKPYSGIIQALVMGDDNQIGLDDWQVFLRTGTSHLMSISGLHITMLAGLMFVLVSFCWRRIPKLVMRLPTRKAATIAGVFAALLYTLIAGFSVPSQRTFYMLLVLAVALWSGRQLVISQVLALALCFVVLLDPWAVNAPGFWLSFGAVAILAYALSARVGEPHWLKAALQTQWAVTIGMLPLLLVMFGQTSIVSPIANAFAIPIISFIVTPLALLGSFLPIDAALHLSYQVLSICMQMLKWVNQMPIVTWQQHAPPAWTLLPAIIGVAWLLLPRGWPMRWLGLVGLLPIFLIVPVRPATGDMKVTVLDIGQGLAVVVQTAAHTLLYDTGPKYNAQSDAGSRIVMPYLQGEGVKKLDGLVVSHNDIDHSGGMQSVLATMPTSWLANSFEPEFIIPTSTRRIPCFAGQSWVWDKVQFEMLYPVYDSYGDAALKDNNRSCVLKVSSQSGSILLTGDIEKESERYLLETSTEKLKSDVMTVPHHGSKTSSTQAFIEAVKPSVSTFTVGYLNRFGHPKLPVVERYQEAGSLWYRSDYDGAVTIDFATDVNGKHEIQMQNWRNQNKRYWQDEYTSGH